MKDEIEVLEEAIDRISGMGMGGKSEEAKGFNLAVDMIVEQLEILKEELS